MKKNNSYILIVLCLIALVSCKKTNNDAGPILPPKVSIDMEGLSSFTSKKKSASISDDSTNFKRAWKFVHNWDSIVQKMVWVPKTIFLEVLNGKSPVYDKSTELWTWTYTKKVVGDGDYQSILIAKVDEDSVSWNMNVSRINGDGMYNFTWMEGRTDIKQTGGWWKLYDPILNKAFLLINWKKETDVSKWIKYTNILECDENNGCFIKYGTTSDIDYNAYFNISLTASGGVSKIEWNTTTYAGRIIYNGWIYGWDATLKSLAPVASN